MPLIFEIVNPLTYPGWDDLVLSSGKGSFFNSSETANNNGETMSRIQKALQQAKKETKDVVSPS
jgi:hypothetical protein